MIPPRFKIGALLRWSGAHSAMSVIPDDYKSEILMIVDILYLAEKNYSVLVGDKIKQFTVSSGDIWLEPL